MALKNSQRNTLTALAFLAPNFLGFLVFVAFPVLFSFIIMLTNWSLKPAVQTRFTGIDNIVQLVGFRPVAPAATGAGAAAIAGAAEKAEGEAETGAGAVRAAAASGGTGWLLAFMGSWAAMIAGILISFMGLGGQWPGLRLGGALGALGGALLILFSIAGWVGVGGGLLGATILLSSFFFLTAEVDSWMGAGAAGPILFLAATALMYALEKPFYARWEPRDAQFWFYFYNTLYLMFAIPISIAGSLILALVLSQPLLKARARHRAALSAALGAIALIGGAALWMAGRRDPALFWITFWVIATLGIAAGPVSFRTLFYLPSFTAGIAVMLLWKHMFNPTFGPINEIVRITAGFLGCQTEGPRWLNDPNWAKPALMLMGFWISVGGANMLLYLAGISNIPQDLYEASSIDGANRWQAFWNVTWPQLAPTTFFIIIMNTIGGLQGGFEQARVMTDGGPAGATKTLAFYVYEKAFKELSMGYGSAIAWVLFAIVFTLTAVNWKFGNRYVNY